MEISGRMLRSDEKDEKVFLHIALKNSSFLFNEFDESLTSLMCVL